MLFRSRDRFDKSLKIYSYLTTKPEEVERRKKAEEAMKKQQIAESRERPMNVTDLANRDAEQSMADDAIGEYTEKHLLRNEKSQAGTSLTVDEIRMLIEEANEELKRQGGM